MQRIIISDKDISLHEEYMNNIVKPRIIKESQKNLGLRDILEKCVDEFKNISTGKPEVLRKLVCEFKKNGYQKRAEKSVVLLECFSYKKFSSNKFAENILEGASFSAVGNVRKYDNEEVLQTVTGWLADISSDLSEKFARTVEERRAKRKSLSKAELVDELELLSVNYECSKHWASWNPYQLIINRGVNVCPYCNRQYATTFRNKDRKFRADIDHYLPKSLYPYLSMSIYNMIPCCKECNTIKSNRKELIDTLSPYEISLDDIAKFTYDGKNIKFKEKESINKKLTQDYEKMFYYSDTYSIHKSIAEKMKENFRKYSMRCIVSKNHFNLSERELLTLIIGDICPREKILNESLGKFKRDMIEEIWGSDIWELLSE